MLSIIKKNIHTYHTYLRHTYSTTKKLFHRLPKCTAKQFKPSRAYFQTRI